MASGEFRVRVFNEALHASLLEPSPLSPASVSAAGRDSHRNWYQSSVSSTSKPRRRRQQGGQNKEEATKHLKERHQQELERFEADCKRRVDEAVRRAEARRERRFQYLEQDIEEGKRYLDELDHEFNRREEARTMKLKKQYNEWDEAVHSRIMNDIRSQIQAMDYKELLAKKNEDMQKFLDTTNRKASIFRDIIIESEYDPLEPNRRAVKARVGTLEDPVKMVLNKHEQERNMLTSGGKSSWRSSRQKPQTTTREVLDVQLWSTEKIKGTPHGIFSKMISSTNKRHEEAGAAQLQTKREARINFDHYNIARGKEVLQAELPKGKRTYPAKRTGIVIT